MLPGFLLSLLGLGVLTAMSPAAVALDISGSSTVQPVVEKLAPLYQAKGGDAVKVAGGGSGAGIRDALSGASEIGMVSRELKDEEKAKLRHTAIGIDALAIIVHRRNPLTALTKAQLIGLFRGDVGNWKELGGADETVVLVSKEVGRSTLELFEHYSGLLSADRPPGDKPRIARRAHVIGSNLEALTLVGGMPGAIGYVSVGTARALAQSGMPVKVLALDGVEPTDAAILARRYPIVRPLNLVYARETRPVAAFLALAGSADGQAVVRSLGFLPGAP